MKNSQYSSFNIRTKKEKNIYRFRETLPFHKSVLDSSSKIIAACRNTKDSRKQDSDEDLAIYLVTGTPTTGKLNSRTHSNRTNKSENQGKNKPRSRKTKSETATTGTQQPTQNKYKSQNGGNPTKQTKIFKKSSKSKTGDHGNPKKKTQKKKTKSVRISRTDLPVRGKVSIDRSVVAALLRTTPRPVPRSSADDPVPARHTCTVKKRVSGGRTV